MTRLIVISSSDFISDFVILFLCCILSVVLFLCCILSVVPFLVSLIVLTAVTLFIVIYPLDFISDFMQVCCQVLSLYFVKKYIKCVTFPLYMAMSLIFTGRIWHMCCWILCLCFHEARLAGRGVMFSTCPLFCSFLCYQTCENKWTSCDVSWHRWSRGQGHEVINFGGQEVKGQRSRSHKTEDTLGGLVDISFSTLLGRIGFLVILRSACFSVQPLFEDSWPG